MLRSAIEGAGFRRLADHHVIAIQDVGIPHRIARDLQDETIRMAQEVVEADPLLLFDSLDRHPSRNLTAKWQPSSAGLRALGEPNRSRPTSVACDVFLVFQCVEMASDAIGGGESQGLTPDYS